MNHRIVWPIGGLLGLVILAVGITTVPAQVRPMPFFGPGQTGRFVVAHATDKQIVVLDTVSGKLYKAGPDDYLKYSELPKVDMPMPFFPDRDRPKDRREEKDREKERPRDGEVKDRKKEKRDLDDGRSREKRDEQEKRGDREGQ